MLSFNELRVFCGRCGDYDIEPVTDEYLASVCGCEPDEIIRCNRCHIFWSTPHIEKHLDDFTSREKRNDIISKRIKFFKMRKDEREQLERTKEENRIKMGKRGRKKKDLKIEGQLMLGEIE